MLIIRSRGLIDGSTRVEVGARLPQGPWLVGTRVDTSFWRSLCGATRSTSISFCARLVYWLRGCRCVGDTLLLIRLDEHRSVSCIQTKRVSRINSLLLLSRWLLPVHVPEYSLCGARMLAGACLLGGAKLVGGTSSLERVDNMISLDGALRRGDPADQACLLLVGGLQM